MGMLCFSEAALAVGFYLVKGVCKRELQKGE